MYQSSTAMPNSLGVDPADIDLGFADRCSLFDMEEEKKVYNHFFDGVERSTAMLLFPSPLVPVHDSDDSLSSS
jgi:hypothetical protein